MAYDSLTEYGAYMGCIAFLMIVPTVLFVILFLMKEACRIKCHISTETRITPAFSMGTATFGFISRFFRGGPDRGILFKICVDAEVAKSLAEELGAIIKDIQDNQDYDEFE